MDLHLGEEEASYSRVQRHPKQVKRASCRSPTSLARGRLMSSKFWS